MDKIKGGDVNLIEESIHFKQLINPTWVHIFSKVTLGLLSLLFKLFYFL